MNTREHIADRLFRRKGGPLLSKVLVFLVILLPFTAVTIFSFVRLWNELAAREKTQHQTVIDRDALFAHALAQGISIYLESARAAVEVAAMEASARPPDARRSPHALDQPGRPHARLLRRLGR